MNAEADQHAFPFGRSAVAVSIAGGVSCVALAIGGGVMGVSEPATMFLAATVVWFAAILALKITAAASRAGSRAVALTHLAGTAVRMVTVMLLSVAAILLLGLDPAAVLVGAAVVYLVVVMVESVMVADYVRRNWPRRREALA